MKPINKILRFFNLTWVVRNEHDLSTSLQPLLGRKKSMLIFGYKTKSEKVLYESAYKIKE
jgi:hypothetical protein